MVAASLILAFQPVNAAAQDSWTPAYVAAADLRGVAFPTVSAGWAVGIGGLVLHTSDGGGSWVRQRSGIATDLTAVDFVDARHGWAAAAGDTLLRTSDGGGSISSTRSTGGRSGRRRC